MKPRPVDASLPVELLRAFLRWNEERFARPSDPYNPESDLPGWRRSSGEDLLWWIRPAAWRSIYEPHGVDPVEAARALRSLELLREQAGEALQCVVIVGKKQSVRAYVVDGGALAAYKPITGSNYRSYADFNLCLNVTDEGKVICTPQYQAKWNFIVDRAYQLGKREADRADALEAELARLREEKAADQVFKKSPRDPDSAASAG